MIGRAEEEAGKRPAAARQTALDMNRWFPNPRGCADLAAFYSREGSAIAASAFASTVSARFIAALSSSPCHASTDWPSSNDRSLAFCARETSSRSASMASPSSLASPPFRVDRVISLSLSHRNYGPSGSMVTTYVYCQCALSNLRRLVRVSLCSDDADRGWQDKSRKVRPVGRLRNISNLNHAPNIAKNWHTLPILPGRCSSSVFDTSRRAR